MLASEIIDRTYNEFLYPAGVNRPAYDTLDAALDNSAKTFNLGGRLDRVPRDAILEIDSELILVQATSGAEVTAHSRGFLETNAAAHAAGARVLLDPTYSRKVILNLLNDVLSMLWPQGVYDRVSDDDTFTSRSVKQLPADGKRLLSVLVRRRGPQELWDRLSRARGHVEVFTEFDPPKYHLRSGGGEDDVIRVTYAKEVGRVTQESDDLGNLGVPTSLQGFLPMGIAGTILQGREVPRTQIEEIRRALAAQGVQLPPGTILNIGQALISNFRTVHLAAEARRLRDLDPIEMEFISG